MHSECQHFYSEIKEKYSDKAEQKVDKTELVLYNKNNKIHPNTVLGKGR